MFVGVLRNQLTARIAPQCPDPPVRERHENRERELLLSLSFVAVCVAADISSSQWRLHYALASIVSGRPTRSLDGQILRKLEKNKRQLCEHVFPHVFWQQTYFPTENTVPNPGLGHHFAYVSGLTGLSRLLQVGICSTCDAAVWKKKISTTKKKI